MVIVIAAGEKGGHQKKVILSSKLKNYAPVFLLFISNIFLFSSFFFWLKNPFFLFFWPTYVLGTLSSMGEKSWNRTILRDYYESSMSRTIRWGFAFSSMTSQWITCHGNENLKVLTHWLPRYVAAILNLLISDTILWLMSLVFPMKFSSG